MEPTLANKLVDGIKLYVEGLKDSELASTYKSFNEGVEITPSDGLTQILQKATGINLSSLSTADNLKHAIEKVGSGNYTKGLEVVKKLFTNNGGGNPDEQIKHLSDLITKGGKLGDLFTKAQHTFGNKGAFSVKLPPDTTQKIVGAISKLAGHTDIIKQAAHTVKQGVHHSASMSQGTAAAGIAASLLVGLGVTYFAGKEIKKWRKENNSRYASLNDLYRMMKPVRVDDDTASPEAEKTSSVTVVKPEDNKAPNIVTKEGPKSAVTVTPNRPPNVVKKPEPSVTVTPNRKPDIHTPNKEKEKPIETGDTVDLSPNLPKDYVNPNAKSAVTVTPARTPNVVKKPEPSVTVTPDRKPNIVTKEEPKTGTKKAKTSNKKQKEKPEEKTTTSVEDEKPTEKEVEELPKYKTKISKPSELKKFNPKETFIVTVKNPSKEGEPDSGKVTVFLNKEIEGRYKASNLKTQDSMKQLVNGVASKVRIKDKDVILNLTSYDTGDKIYSLKKRTVINQFKPPLTDDEQIKEAIKAKLLEYINTPTTGAWLPYPAGRSVDLVDLERELRNNTPADNQNYNSSTSVYTNRIDYERTKKIDDLIKQMGQPGVDMYNKYAKDNGCEPYDGNAKVFNPVVVPKDDRTYIDGDGNKEPVSEGEKPNFIPEHKRFLQTLEDIYKRCVSKTGIKPLVEHIVNILPKMNMTEVKLLKAFLKHKIQKGKPEHKEPLQKTLEKIESKYKNQ